MYTYDTTIELKTDTFRAHSSTENRVRTMFYDPSVADHSESLLVFPQRMIVAESDDSAEPYALSHFRPRGLDNLFVLSGYAAIKDRAARHKLLKSPCLFAPIGQRVGAEAASVARKVLRLNKWIISQPPVMVEC